MSEHLLQQQNKPKTYKTMLAQITRNKHIAFALLSATLLAGTAHGNDGTTGSSGGNPQKHPAVVLSEKCSDMERKLESVRGLAGGRDAMNRALADALKTAKDTPADISVPVAEAVCSGLLALGQNEVYAKVRGALRNPDSFAEPVLATCPVCNGEGAEKKECPDCHGSGRCGNSSCDNGKTYLAMVGMVSCPRCGGSGRCKTCNATGIRSWPCQRCHKSGRVVDPNKAMRLFSEKLESALSACRCGEVVPVTGISGSGPTLEKATSDALVKAAQKVLGPEGAAQQKLLGTSDRTIVKGFKVVSKGEDESGLFTVKANVLVVKELKAPARNETRDSRFGTSEGGTPTGTGGRKAPARTRSPVDDSFNSGDPFGDDPWN